MKKLLFAVCALAAISLLAPSAGFAQEFQNRIGVYTTADAAACSTAAAANVPFNFYVVAVNPVGATGVWTSLDAFEFTMTITHGVGDMMFRLAETLAPGAINVGTYTDQYNAEFACGFATPVPITNGFATLVTWNVMCLTTGPFLVYLGPADPASVPGMMALNNTVAGNADLVGCLPSSGAVDQPVFGINAPGQVIPVQESTFGDVKALFR